MSKSIENLVRFFEENNFVKNNSYIPDYTGLCYLEYTIPSTQLLIEVDKYESHPAYILYYRDNGRGKYLSFEELFLELPIAVRKKILFRLELFCK